MVLDEIKRTQKDFLNAVIEKKRSNRRKWMELESMTNAHLLIHLPYQAQLNHVSQLVEERRPLIAEIQERNSQTNDQTTENSSTSTNTENVEVSSK